MARVRRVASLCGTALLLVGCAGSGSTGAGEPVAPFHPATVSDAPAKPANTFTVVATGDVLVHPALTEQAEEDGSNGKRDFAPLFAGVKPVVEAADLAICHLEVPLAGPDGPFEGYPLFSAPPEVADALAATGYDTCSTASNHTFDQGADGVRTTLDTLDAVKLGHTGSARTETESQTPLVREVNGVKVGQVSFTFDFNQGTEEPSDMPWMANELSVDARARGGVARRGRPVPRSSSRACTGASRTSTTRPPTSGPWPSRSSPTRPST